MDKSIRCALLGNGFIGKVHQQAIQDNQNTELVAIVDINEPEKNTTLPYFSNLDELKQSDIAVDLVAVATPNGLHAEQTLEALDLGYHVLVEKPITLNSKSLEEVLHKAEAKNLRIYNMLQLRFSPIVKWVKELLDQEALGKVNMINVQCFWNRNEEYYQKRKWHGSREMDGGVLFTQFSHFIDILHFWFESIKPKHISSHNFAHQKSTEFPDSGLIDFTLKKGGLGTMMYTTATYDKNFESTITLLTEKATLQIAGQYMNELRYFHSKNIESPFQDSVKKQWHAEAYHEVANSLLNKTESILDAHHARNVIQLLEVIS